MTTVVDTNYWFLLKLSKNCIYIKHQLLVKHCCICKLVCLLPLNGVILNISFHTIFNSRAENYIGHEQFINKNYSYITYNYHECCLWIQQILWQDMWKVLTYRPLCMNTWVGQHQNGKPFRILIKQEMKGWQWHQLMICKLLLHLASDKHASTPHHSIFYRLQPIVSKHWRQQDDMKIVTAFQKAILLSSRSISNKDQLAPYRYGKHKYMNWHITSCNINRYTMITDSSSILFR